MTTTRRERVRQLREARVWVGTTVAAGGWAVLTGA